MKTASDLTEVQPYRRVVRGTVAAQIFDNLRNQIFAGTLTRGEKLPTERELAVSYGVSGATIREAIGALAAMRLVDVRHGSGSYVTADAESLIGMSLNSMIQIERIGVGDVLGILGVLNTYAAELAAARATPEEIGALHEILDRIETAEDVDTMAGNLISFLHGLASASGNPLLTALCKFLTALQIQLALELSGGSLKTWKQIAGGLAKQRRMVVDAIERRDAEAARDFARDYQKHALKVIQALPNASAARLNDPKLSDFLSALMRRMDSQ
ncbi:MAG: FadR family transcriptional regulator [Rhodocyclaceae bacterium]|nr:MAG: FadR family transcriptional regulator [Rhodocyclaceae bacterium]